MAMEPLFLDSIFQEKIWGGTKLKTVFGYDLPSDQVGEYWAISAHPHGVSTIKNGQFKGEKLDHLWATQPQLFGNPQVKVFPLLTKILDAADYLSVQVHPDDQYAKEHEGELGKTECWYIIDAEPNAEIIYGHHAKSREELAKMIYEGRWDDLLTHVHVKKGEFYYVPSGTMHAIGSGVLILETQQSSDTTYRVYDFDRKDKEGNLRELHLQQSIDVMNIPGTTPDNKTKVSEVGSAKITTFVESPFFNVYKWEVNDRLKLTKNAPYTLASVIEGTGKLIVGTTSYDLKKGDHFILPSDVDSWELTGKLELITSVPGEKNR